MQQLDCQQLHHQKRNGELQRLNATQMEEMDTEISDLRAQLERTREEMLTEREKHRLIAENLHGEIAVLQKELQAVSLHHIRM